MNNLTILSSSTITMSSLEIAKLVESRHDNVKTSIEKLVKKGVINEPAMQVLEEINGLGLKRETKVYNLEKRDSFVVVAQLSPEFTARLVDRWQELEEQNTKPPVPLLPAQIALETAKAELELFSLFNVPRSFAIQEIAKIVSQQSGIDHTRALTQAEGMNNVPIEDVMLEPTELGELFGLSAIQMNKWLAREGLQEKRSGQWTPIGEGTALCKQHAWVSGAKSGYNLKWIAAAIEQRIKSNATPG